MAPKETNGAQNEGSITPGAQNATSTVPSRLGEISAAMNRDDSEETKIVSSSPGV